MRKKQQNSTCNNFTQQSTYLIHSSDRIASTSTEFSDCAGLRLLFHIFPSWILWLRVGLYCAQWKALAQGHSQRVKRGWGAKLTKTIGGFWRAFCPIRLIQDCMCAPDSNHSLPNSIHHWRCHVISLKNVIGKPISSTFDKIKETLKELK